LGLGYSWEEYVGHYIGFDDRDAFREAFACTGRTIDTGELAGLIEQKAAAFNTIIGTGVTPFPGVVELINSLKGRCPLALCSGALASDIGPILQQIDLTEAFDIKVTADEVSVSKPDPESYRLAVKRLAEAFPQAAIAPSQCLAIEDTPAGIVSATGAGLKVLAVTNSYPAEKLVGAITVVDSLAGIDHPGLEAYFRSHS
jgi:HAD superfamily hydrolase (TIGR01509 family)